MQAEIIGPDPNCDCSGCSIERKVQETMREHTEMVIARYRARADREFLDPRNRRERNRAERSARTEIWEFNDRLLRGMRRHLTGCLHGFVIRAG